MRGKKFPKSSTNIFYSTHTWMNMEVQKLRTSSQIARVKLQETEVLHTISNLLFHSNTSRT